MLSANSHGFSHVGFDIGRSLPAETGRSLPAETGRSLPAEWFSSALATGIRAPAQVRPVHFRVSPQTGEPLRSQVLLGRDLGCP